MKQMDIEVHKSHDDIDLETASGKAAIPSVIEHVTAIPEQPLKALAWLYPLEKKLAHLFRWATVLLSMALGFLMAAQVFMRYVLQSPFLGIEELAPMLGLWVYFLGMTNATRERDHITGGIISLIFSNAKIICSIRIFGTVSCLIATCVFGYYAQKYAMFNFGIGRKSPYMGYSKALWDFSMVTGFVLTGFYFILQFISEGQQLTSLFKKKGDVA